MSNHSVIEHRANYHFLKVEEDYLAICSTGSEAPHCKALILAILEHWTNTKRDQEQGEWVYLSLPEWVEQTYEFYGRNVLINCLKELLDAGLVERRAIVRYDQDTFEYKLTIDAIQTLIRALPEKSPKDIKPNLAAYRELQEQKRVQREKERKAKEQDEEGSLNLNGGVVEKSTALKSKRGVVEKSTQGRLKKDDGSLKSKRNIDSSLTSFPASSQIRDGAAIADTTARTSSSQEKDAKENTDGPATAGSSGHSRGDDDHHGDVPTHQHVQGAAGDQERVAHTQRTRNTPRAERAHRAGKTPGVTLSEQAQAFFTLYCSMPWIKVPPEITSKVNEQCERYGRVFQTQEQLFSLKNWMAKDKFFKGKGFSLSLMGLAINDFSMTQEDVQETRKPASPPRVISEEERHQLDVKKAALLAQLQATTPMVMGGAR